MDAPLFPQACLFVPGDSERKIVKAFQSRAGTVILDLEDGVAPDQKKHARTIVADALQDRELQTRGQRILLRCNAVQTAEFQDDLCLLQAMPSHGVLLAKCESADEVQYVAEQLPKGEIVALIESALGVHQFETIAAAHPRLRQAAFGSVDFALDLGVDWTPEGIERTYSMGKIAVTSRALRLQAPIDAVFPRLDSQVAFEKEARMGRALGFESKMVIHPTQIKWLANLYRLPLEEAAWCQRVVEAYESSLITSGAGALQLDGTLIDLPVYQRAKRRLAHSE